jgi:hypothetical protein
MNLRLAEIAKDVAPGRHAVLLVDQAAAGRRSGGLVSAIWILDRLDCLEALEVGMAEIERLIGAGVTMRGAKMFGLRPGGEGSFALPGRVR